MSVQGYWIRSTRTERWREVSREEYIEWERWAGFSAPEGELATAAFATHYGLQGTTFNPRGGY